MPAAGLAWGFGSHGSTSAAGVPSVTLDRSETPGIVRGLFSGEPATADPAGHGGARRFLAHWRAHGRHDRKPGRRFEAGGAVRFQP